MSDLSRQAHWENVYTIKDEKAVSWFQEKADISIDLIHATGVDTSASIIDIGGGASRLVDALISQGFKAVTVLDLSEKALATSKARLGARAAHVQWVVADITTWEPSQTYDVWHDRAALHFLTDPKDRAAYAERVLRAVRPDGHIIIGTFAPDGPERCSGLPVVRHDAATLGMSALPPKADICWREWRVRFVTTTDIQMGFWRDVFGPVGANNIKFKTKCSPLIFKQSPTYRQIRLSE